MDIYTFNFTDDFVEDLKNFPTPDLPEDAVSNTPCGELHPRYGLKCSEETKKRMSQSRLGKTHSKETLDKMSKLSSYWKKHWCKKILVAYGWN